jgi:hypothetical protein
VGKGDDFEITRASETVKEAEDEISGESEDMANPGAAEVGDQEIAQLHTRTHPRSLLGS